MELERKAQKGQRRLRTLVSKFVCPIVSTTARRKSIWNRKYLFLQKYIHLVAGFSVVPMQCRSNAALRPVTPSAFQARGSLKKETTIPQSARTQGNFLGGDARSLESIWNSANLRAAIATSSRFRARIFCIKLLIYAFTVRSLSDKT